MEKDLQILVMDDEVDYATFICDVALGMNIKCSISTNANEFIKKLSSVDLIFLDLNIPDTDGIELLNIIKKKIPQCHII